MSYFDKDAPFDELPLLPPGCDLESPEIMRACIKASRSLSELQGLMETIPDKRILLELLPMQESESSSAIENIISSKKRLFLASSGKIDSNDRFEREILGYNRALVSTSKEIPDLKTIKKICSIIRDEDVDFRQPGDEPVALFAVGSNNVIYTPPSGEAVQKLMRNLQEYIFTDDEIDPLIKMAVIHYQFEAIHPFFDGNGRTGRLLNVVYLQYAKLLRYPILFLSGYIIDNKKCYYDLLRSVTTDEDWTQWILFMLDAVDKTSNDTIHQIRQIVDLIKEYKNECYNNSIPEKCIDVVFGNPFCTISTLQEQLGCSRPSANKYLRSLESMGLLQSSKNKNMVIYENVKLTQVFTK